MKNFLNCNSVYILDRYTNTIEKMKVTSKYLPKCINDFGKLEINAGAFSFTVMADASIGFNKYYVICTNKKELIATT